MPKLKRPVQKTKKPHWVYLEIAEYIEKKHGVDLRCYKGNHDHDFWMWLINHNSYFSNESYIYVNTSYFAGSKPDPDEMWVVEILKLFEEFEDEDGDVFCWLSW
jgi:hypothetical protein